VSNQLAVVHSTWWMVHLYSLSPVRALKGAMDRALSLLDLGASESATIGDILGTAPGSLDAAGGEVSSQQIDAGASIRDGAPSADEARSRRRAASRSRREEDHQDDNDETRNERPVLLPPVTIPLPDDD